VCVCDFSLPLSRSRSLSLSHIKVYTTPAVINATPIKPAHSNNNNNNNNSNTNTTSHSPGASESSYAFNLRLAQNEPYDRFKRAKASYQIHRVAPFATQPMIEHDSDMLNKQYSEASLQKRVVCVRVCCCVSKALFGLFTCVFICVCVVCVINKKRLSRSY